MKNFALLSLVLAAVLVGYPATSAEAQLLPNGRNLVLDRAVLDYETEMESTRKEVLSHIESKIKEAEEDAARQDRLRAILSDWRDRAVWPPIDELKISTYRTTEAGKNLSKEYKDVIERSNRSGTSKSLVEQLQEEHRIFDEYVDVAPWRDFKVDPPNAFARLDEQNKELPYAIEMGEEGYRVEIVAVRLTQKGTFDVDIPWPKKGSVPMRLRAVPPRDAKAVDAEFRVYATVTDSFVCPNFGLERTEKGGAANNVSQAITLRHVAGNFEVKSVRWKPLVKGKRLGMVGEHVPAVVKIAQAQNQNIPPNPQIVRAVPVDVLREKREFRGKRWVKPNGSSEDINGRVMERDAKNGTARILISKMGEGNDEIELLVNDDGTMQIDNGGVTSGYRRGREYIESSGSGCFFSKDGTDGISLQAKVKFNQGRRKGHSEEWTIEVRFK